MVNQQEYVCSTPRANYHKLCPARLTQWQCFSLREISILYIFLRDSILVKTISASKTAPTSNLGKAPLSLICSNYFLDLTFQEFGAEIKYYSWTYFSYFQKNKPEKCRKKALCGMYLSIHPPVFLCAYPIQGRRCQNVNSCKPLQIFTIAPWGLNVSCQFGLDLACIYAS